MTDMRRASVVLLLAGSLAAPVCGAQPVTREVLQELQVIEDARGGCQRVITTLAFPLAIEGYAPPHHGTQLLVKVLPLPGAGELPQAIGGREALVPEPGHATALRDVSWEGNGSDGPQLLFRFASDVTYDVTSGADFRSVVVTLRPSSPDPAPCQNDEAAPGTDR